MHIWKLLPQDVSALDWEASTYCGIVIVRAKCEEEARLCATQRFGVATKRDPMREDLRLNPWTQSALVSCEELISSDYPKTGDAKVLEPRDV